MSYVPIFPTKRRLSEVNPKREKRFSCPIEGCNKAYLRKAFVTEHLRSHSNTRPFACDQCDKKFLRESHLKSHKWVHAEQKPLGCDHCERRFITNQQLRRHLKTHEPKEMPLADDQDPFPARVLYRWKAWGGARHRVDASPSPTRTTNTTSPDESSSSSRTPVSSTEQTPELLMCPYDCSNVFQDTKSLSGHILEDHVLTDTLNVDDHLSHLQKNLGDSPNEYLMQRILKWDGKDWSEVHCMEVDCQGPSLCFTDHQSLMAHYEAYHGFIPDSLFEYTATEMND